MTKSSPPIRIIYRPLGRLFYKIGFIGITLPPFGIFINADYKDNARLISMRHATGVSPDLGAMMFTKYLWSRSAMAITTPYGVAARAAAEQPSRQEDA